MAKDDKFRTDIPSPVSLDYPHRNLTKFVGAIPSTLDVDETKKRINDYYNITKNSEFPQNDYLDLEDAINTAYVNDLIKKSNIINPNAEQIKEVIAKDLNWPDLHKNTISYNFVDDVKREPPLVDRISSLLGQNIDSIGGYNAILRSLTAQKNDIPTIYHEMKHADDSSYGGFLNNLIRLKDQAVEGQHSWEKVDPYTNYKDVFELSDLMGETQHHIPLYLNNKEESTMLLEPFLKAGMKADTAPRSTWDKIKRLFKGPK